VALDAQIIGGNPSGPLEYWCTLLDRSGGELGFVDSAEEPAKIRWEPRPKPPEIIAAVAPAGMGATTPAPVVVQQVESAPPFYKSWWFWTGVGVIVAGSASYAVYRAIPRDVSPSDHASYTGNAIQ